MSISFDLPASVEDQLRRELADLDVVAKEAVLVELYRQGRLTHHQLGLSLGLARDFIVGQYYFLARPVRP